MNVGIKALLLVVSALLFLIAVFVDNPTDWWSFGLLLLALAFLVETLGLDRPLGTMAGTPPRRREP